MKALIVKIKAHPLCLHFQPMNDRFRVLYPEGYFPNGVQASYAIGKRIALSRMLDAMERHWKENGIGEAAKRHKLTLGNTCLLTEAAELESRLEKLGGFLCTPDYHKLAPYDGALLRNQQRHMQAYLDVLRIRIARIK